MAFTQENKKQGFLGNMLKKVGKKLGRAGKVVGKNIVRGIVEGNIPQYTKSVLLSGDEKSTRKIRELYTELPEFYENIPEFVKRKLATLTYLRTLNNGYKNVGLKLKTPGIGITVIDVFVTALSPFKEETTFFPSPEYVRDPYELERLRRLYEFYGRNQKKTLLDIQKIIESLWGVFMFVVEKQRQLVLKTLTDKVRIQDMGRKEVEFGSTLIEVEYVTDVEGNHYIVKLKMKPRLTGEELEKMAYYIPPPDKIPMVPKGEDLDEKIKEIVLMETGLPVG